MKRIIYLMILSMYLTFMSVSCLSGHQDEHGHTHEHNDDNHEHTHDHDSHDHHDQEEFIVGDSSGYVQDEEHENGDEHDHDHEHGDDHQH